MLGTLFDQTPLWSIHFLEALAEHASLPVPSGDVLNNYSRLVLSNPGLDFLTGTDAIRCECVSPQRSGISGNPQFELLSFALTALFYVLRALQNNALLK